MTTIAKTPVFTVHNAEDNLTASVFRNPKGFTVVLRDDDAGENLPYVRTFKKLDDAQKNAAHIAGGGPKVALGDVIECRTDDGEWELFGTVDSEELRLEILKTIKMGRHPIASGQHSCEYRVR